MNAELFRENSINTDEATSLNKTYNYHQSLKPLQMLGTFSYIFIPVRKQCHMIRNAFEMYPYSK